jgi:hypothetical protein
MYSKSSVVVALCLLPTERMNFWKSWWFLSKIASEKCFESCSRWSVHCKIWKQNHLWRRKREQLALMAADV